MPRGEGALFNPRMTQLWWQTYYIHANPTTAFISSGENNDPEPKLELKYMCWEKPSSSVAEVSNSS